MGPPTWRVSSQVSIMSVFIFFFLIIDWTLPTYDPEKYLTLNDLFFNIDIAGSGNLSHIKSLFELWRVRKESSAKWLFQLQFFPSACLFLMYFLAFTFTTAVSVIGNPPASAS